MVWRQLPWGMVVSQDSSKSNLLLAALGADDYAMLHPHLTQVRLEQHAVVQEPEQPIQHIYFPL